MAEHPLTAEVLAGLPAAVHEPFREALAAAPDPDAFLLRWSRFLDQGGDRLRPQAEAGVRLLNPIFAHSHFLAQYVTRRPEELTWLVRHARRVEARTVEDFQEGLARFCLSQSDVPETESLQRFKLRELLRLTDADLLDQLELPDLCRALSLLADALLERVVTRHRHALRDRYGPPLATAGSGERTEATFTVISLGKLGGLELNYSSDIDLLYLYSEEGTTAGLEGKPETVISNREYFAKLAERVTGTLGGQAGTGAVYRVDLALRPSGGEGEIVHSVNAALAYYRNWAGPLERLALIKARPSAGDRALGRHFVHQAWGILYQSRELPLLLEEMRSVKARIDRELAAAGRSETHLKLGRGGIRELEFAVQALQLTHGREEAWVRETNCLRALYRLTERGFLPVSAYADLYRAYCFLRQAEHRLQMADNRQVYDLPAAGPARARFAAGLGFAGPEGGDAAAFQKVLDGHRQRIQRFYDTVVSEALSGDRVADPGAALPDPEREPRASQLWHQVEAALALAELPDPAAPAPPVLIAAAAAGCRGGVETERYLVHLLGLVTHPDPATRARLAGILTRTGPRRVLSRMLGRAALLAELIQRTPEVMEALIGPPAGLPEGWPPISGEDDPTAALAGLRREKARWLFHIGARDLLGEDPLPGTLDQLSRLARGVLARCWDLTLAALGAPPDLPCVCLALGTLARGEMSYYSDVDLCFLVEGDAQVRSLATRVVQAYIRNLTTLTQEGYLYRVDLRLRPRGRAGELLTTPEGFLRYLEREAAVWERQALCSVRPVTGAPGVWGSVRPRLQALLSAPVPGLAGALRRMRRKVEEETRPLGTDQYRLKAAPGGLFDVQFLLDYLSLTQGAALGDPDPPLSRLAAAREAGAISSGHARRLADGYRFQKRLEHALQLAFHEYGNARRLETGKELHLVGKIMPEQLEEGDAAAVIPARLAEHQAGVRAAFEVILPAG